MPPPVAGIANLLAVPIGAVQIGRIRHGRAQRADGTAANASRVPSEPLTLADLTTHTTADRGLVPAEVTTGEPDVNPNRMVLLATSASRGRPPGPASNFSARK